MKYKSVDECIDFTKAYTYTTTVGFNTMKFVTTRRKKKILWLSNVVYAISGFQDET